MRQQCQHLEVVQDAEDCEPSAVGLGFLNR